MTFLNMSLNLLKNRKMRFSLVRSSNKRPSRFWRTRILYSAPVRRIWRKCQPFLRTVCLLSWVFFWRPWSQLFCNLDRRSTEVIILEIIRSLNQRAGAAIHQAQTFSASVNLIPEVKIIGGFVDADEHSLIADLRRVRLLVSPVLCIHKMNSLKSRNQLKEQCDSSNLRVTDANDRLLEALKRVEENQNALDAWRGALFWAIASRKVRSLEKRSPRFDNRSSTLSPEYRRNLRPLGNLLTRFHLSPA